VSKSGQTNSTAYSLDDADAAAGYTMTIALEESLRQSRRLSVVSRSESDLLLFSNHDRIINDSENDEDSTPSQHSISESIDSSYPAAVNNNYHAVKSSTFNVPMTKSHAFNSNYYGHSKGETKTGKNKVLLLGIDISHLSKRSQFITCATGVFSFSLLYGFLQELISVTICGRSLGLFQASLQFIGYTLWSYFFRKFVNRRHGSLNRSTNHLPLTSKPTGTSTLKVPFQWYILLSLLRALDLAMTNMAMAYVNYPAKTLMKSSRVAFTMLFGTLFQKKTYRAVDYMVVALMVSGLCMFMHADATSSAVFHPLGITMLTISLLCDGAISNMSERIMNQYEVGQDEFIFWLYSIATLAITFAAAISGDLLKGLVFLFTPGTLHNIQNEVALTSIMWTVPKKIITFTLFSTMGFFGSSCSAAITKHYGALTMSITSTARKAATLFFSFAYFGNVCNTEHVCGIILFIISLITKSLKSFRSGQPCKGDGKSITTGICFNLLKKREKPKSSTHELASSRYRKQRNYVDIV